MLIMMVVPDGEVDGAAGPALPQERSLVAQGMTMRTSTRLDTRRNTLNTRPLHEAATTLSQFVTQPWWCPDAHTDTTGSL